MGLRRIVQSLRAGFRTVTARLGFRIVRIRRPQNPEPGLYYESVLTGARYAPWHNDQTFRDTFDAASGNTLVDRYRAYELWTLAAQAKSLPPGDVLEVGVWRGGTGCLLASAFAGTESRTFLADTFEGVVKTGAVDGNYKDGDHSDASIDQVRALAKRLNVEVEILVGIFPDDSADQIASNTFRFCHIDVDIYQSAKDVFDWVWPRMVPGGIVVFDDYGFQSCPGVSRFVDEMRYGPDRLYLHNLNGHAVLVKK